LKEWKHQTAEHAFIHKHRGRRDRGRPRNHSNASITEEFNRPKSWRKMMKVFEFGGKCVCDATGVTNVDYSIIVFLN